MIKLDKETIIRLKQQDHSAFNTFYLETVDMFFRYIEANYFIPYQDTQDLIADFYVKFREAIKKYDDKQSFSWYVRTIFKNLIKDFFKKNREIPFTNLETEDQDNHFEDSLIDNQNIEDILDQNFEIEKIKEALKELDDISKDIVYRKFIEEKSNEEIQLILWITNDNIRQKFSRAIKQLKSRLKNDI